jgi:hypothetical protein
MGHPGYSRPVLMINGLILATTPQVIKGCRHLSQINGWVIWPTGVTAGKVVVDIVPTENFPQNQDGEIIFSSDVVADSVVIPASISFTYPGPVPYIRHRIVTDIVGGTVTTYHDGYSN